MIPICIHCLPESKIYISKDGDGKSSGRHPVVLHWDELRPHERLENMSEGGSLLSQLSRLVKATNIIGMIRMFTVHLIQQVQC